MKCKSMAGRVVPYFFLDSRPFDQTCRLAFSSFLIPIVVDACPHFQNTRLAISQF